MLNTNLWLALGGMATVCAVTGTVGLWALKAVIRAELAPMRDDILALRAAVFNHLSHGETPNEGEIRAALGLAERA